MSSTRVTRSSKKTKSNIKVDEVKVHSEPTISLSDQKKKAQAWAEQQGIFSGSKKDTGKESKAETLAKAPIQKNKSRQSTPKKRELISPVADEGTKIRTRSASKPALKNLSSSFDKVTTAEEKEPISSTPLSTPVSNKYKLSFDNLTMISLAILFVLILVTLLSRFNIIKFA